MSLTPEEEKKIREQIRKELEKKENNLLKNKDKESIERKKLADAEVRALIKAEEEEKFYKERGFVQYKNRYGETEWLTPEEVKKRRTARKKRRPSRTQAKKRRKLLKILINVSIFAIVGFAVLYIYKYQPPSKSEYGTVVIQSDIAGARIFANGRELDKFTPDSIGQVRPGHYYVSVYKEGYTVWPPMLSVSVKANKLVQAKFSLMQSSIMSKVIINTNIPGFDLYIDGIRTDFKDNQVDVTAGYHVIAVVKKGHISTPLYQRVLIEPEKIMELNFEFSQPEEVAYLHISSSMGSEYVYIDQEFTGLKANGKLISLKPGLYDVSVRENGYISSPSTEMINLLPDEKELLVFRSVKSDESRIVTVQTKNPGAIAIVDGKYQPYVSPLINLELSPGSHYLNFVREGELYSEGDIYIDLNKLIDEKLMFDF
jgi:hypothetical protein